MNEIAKVLGAVNPAGSSGLKVQAAPVLTGDDKRDAQAAAFGQRDPEKIGLVPTAVETLEHLEQTLDNLDPVVPATPAELRAATDAQLEALTDEQLAAIDAGADKVIANEAGERLQLKKVADEAFERTFDKAADAVIADVTGDASVEAVEPVNVPEGTDDDKAGE